MFGPTLGKRPPHLSLFSFPFRRELHAQERNGKKKEINLDPAPQGDVSLALGLRCNVDAHHWRRVCDARNVSTRASRRPVKAPVGSFHISFHSFRRPAATTNPTPAK